MTLGQFREITEKYSDECLLMIRTSSYNGTVDTDANHVTAAYTVENTTTVPILLVGDA